MDTKINDVIIKIKEIEVLLIELYQDESIGYDPTTSNKITQINDLMVWSHLTFADVAMKYYADRIDKLSHLTVVK